MNDIPTDSIQEDHLTEKHLGHVSVKALLNELGWRNELGPAHRNNKDQANEHIRKLRLAFSLRPGGLDAKRTDV